MSPSLAPELVETIPLSGFDPAAEPELRRFSDGSLQLVFGFMPPSFVSDDGGWVDLGRYWKFDEELARALESEVVWEYRESFRISHPRDDTVERLREFLARYHAKQG